MSVSRKGPAYMTTEDVPKRHHLTKEMRGWLIERQCPVDERVTDFVLHFMREFGLTSREAGRIIGRWICETII